MPNISPLRILHVASFSGNIGDNANHMGFRPWIERLVDRPVVWTQLEIREFYWKERMWDDDFVAQVNAHDLAVIGGGNYFELWVDSSPTGTSIAIDPATFARIKTPIFFNALGVDPGQGASETALARFRAFLDTLLASPNHLVSVRNDGASANLARWVGQAYAEAIDTIPDAGFFVAPALARLLPTPREEGPRPPRFAVNIASDMADIRFGQFDDRDGRSAFAAEFAHALENLAAARPEAEIVMVPHIFRDLEIISEVIGHLGDRLRRTRLSVAPYGSGNRAALGALRIYEQSDAVLAMRFHANICPIGLGRQTIGLNCYPQIANLYSELGQPDRALDISRPGFSAALTSVALDALDAPDRFLASPAAANARVFDLREAFEPKISAWLDRHGLAAGRTTSNPLAR
ncbi:MULTISPECIES: polysaccharide pyruvyl transferase family protein [unclassified Sphingomonas]|uniref:polysaccharide pyruvyl transferase family protein n=1 Tax=unclassified Sphingomonas TaxID=196159 RepID=UPI00070131D3|nr:MULTISPECIES: polysaccharide pyruvyl transferase family protein [unclassified Sphingomonas]KQX19533.1 hypothetical protein ASD17_13545 [Sphingomonas sp. Root1294]KQY65734.1 hypothetical protein ASD39_16745 [Sphingomonas sp. Root50]KRB94961.1 hypothetical protein ASE22_03310 [Sphingomonas sp. Root720]